MSKGLATAGASIAVALFIVLAAVTIALPAAASASSPGSVPRIRAASGSSLNWSGYAVTAGAGSVTDVKGSWVVPAVACQSGGTEYSSFWVGIDGFTSSTVEQLGTDSDCQSGSPAYYAWYEFYPKPSFQVASLPVHAGDTVTAEVTYSGGSFTVSMTVNSQTFTKTQRVNSAQRSSAEWIAEAPSSGGSILPLADFGTVGFGLDNTGVQSTNYATVNGVTGSIASFGNSVQSIAMVTSSGAVKAQPSALSSDGTSFSVTWYSSGSSTSTSSSTSSSSSSSSSVSSSTTAGSSLSVSVTTDSPSYTPNSWAYVSVHVAAAGTAVAGATVTVAITSPTGGVSTGTGTTSSTGDVVFRYRVGPHASSGTYSVAASASASGYGSGSGSTTFTVA